MIGAVTVVQGGEYLADSGHLGISGWIIGIPALVTGASLLIGFATPLAGGLAGAGIAGIALSLLPICATNLFDATLLNILGVTMAATIVFLGPGAYSLDARMFGRREIVIPATRRSVPPSS